METQKVKNEDQWIEKINLLLEGHELEDVLALAISIISTVVDGKFDDEHDRRRLRLILEVLYEAILLTPTRQRNLQ